MSAPAVNRQALPGHPRRRRLIVATLAAAVLAALAVGAVPLPDVQAALTRLADSLGTWTYGFVAALAFLETGAFVGLVVPGETAIVLGGVAAAGGSVDLALLIPLAWTAAALGDLVSFLLGRRLGRRFMLVRGPALGVSPARFERVEAFFARHGAKAIVVGRFIGIVRAVAPFIAGASGMRLRTFVPWSVVGTGLWATTFTLIGFAFHRSFAAAADALTHGALAVAVAAAVVLIWRHHRRARLHLAGRPATTPVLAPGSGVEGCA